MICVRPEINGMVNPIIVICLTILPATVFGCSCAFPPEYSTPLESLCRDYQWSSDVFAGRVISASCNCIPPLNDSSQYGQANISCLSGNVSEEYFTSAVVAGATCDAFFPSFGILSCDRVLDRFKPIDCPYEGQVFMDCAPLCPTTCSNMDVASPCPSVCVGGCGCPEGMVIDEEQRRCVMPSQCPDKGCRLVGQVTTLCISSCPQDCFRPGNESCVRVCDGCTCAPPAIADYITGRCVQPEQCTACPIEGQVYTECGSSCPRTCDNVNDTIMCTSECWQGCECPSGLVIDVERRRCVEPSQCIRELPPIIASTGENGQCTQEYICPFNTPQNNNFDFNVCQYTLEVTEVFKGDNEVSQMIVDRGPDLLTSCGNPENILSVGTTYVVGIGGPCGAYSEWTPYSQYPTEHRQALANGCSNSSTSVTVTSSSTSVGATVTSFAATVTSTSVATTIVHPTPSSPVDDNSSDDAATSNNNGSSDSSAIIIGGVVGGVILVLMITVVLCVVILCVRRCHQTLDNNVSYNKTKVVTLHPTRLGDLDVPITANPSYAVPTKPYSKANEDEYIYVQPNNEFNQKTIMMTTNPSYGVTIAEDRATAFSATTSDAKANRPSYNATPKEYDYVYANDDRLLHHNAAAHTTGDAKVRIHDAVDQSHNTQAIHSLYLPLKSNGEDEYGVINQPKCDDPNIPPSEQVDALYI